MDCLQKSGTGNAIETIACATDLSDASDHLIAASVKLCLRFDAFLWILHTIPFPRGSVTRQVEFDRGGEKKEKIKSARKKINTLMNGFTVRWDGIVTYGDPVLEITRAAAKIKADMVIAGSLGLSGFQQFFMGSLVGSMAHSLVQPLLVMPPPSKPVEKTPFTGLKRGQIIIACSLKASDHRLKRLALTFSQRFGSDICLVHVMESPLNDAIVESTSAPYDRVQKQLENKLALRLKSLMPAEIQILKGVPGEELALYAKQQNADLIIAGIDDRPGRIIATTTAALLRHLPCAVLTVPITA